MFPPNAQPRSIRSMRYGMNKHAGALSIALILGGCAVGPDYQAPAPNTLGVPSTYAPPVTNPAGSATAAPAGDLSGWWRQFDDPLLTGLMDVDYVFDPVVNLGSLLFSSFLGIVFGYVPAQRAAALNPIDALRHE